MNTPALPGLPATARRRPGRPKGSTNKRSGDLQRYVEAVYGGLTPGQQGAAISLVTAKELRDAGGDLVEAMAAKAVRLARRLGCDPKEAWLLMQKERADLLPYIHQKRATKEEGDAAAPPVHFVAVPIEGATAAGQGGELGEWDTPPDLLENQGVNEPAAEHVTAPKSQDDAGTVDG